MMTSLIQITALTLVLVGGSAAGRWIGSRVGLSAMNASLLVSCSWGLLGMGIDNRAAWGRIESWAWLQPGLDNAGQIATLVLMFYAGLLVGGPREKTYLKHGKPWEQRQQDLQSWPVPWWPHISSTLCRKAFSSPPRPSLEALYSLMKKERQVPFGPPRLGRSPNGLPHSSQVS